MFPLQRCGEQGGVGLDPSTKLTQYVLEIEGVLVLGLGSNGVADSGPYVM